jgi:hypothetical protein
MLQNELTSKGKNDEQSYSDNKPAEQETDRDSEVRSAACR